MNNNLHFDTGADGEPEAVASVDFDFDAVDNALVADKRRSVELALAEWPNLSDRELARICAVNNHLVADVRQLGDSPSSETRTGADGKQRKLPVRKAQPKYKHPIDLPEPPEETGDGQAPEPEPPDNSLTELARRFLGVVMAGKTMLERDRRLHCLVFKFTPSLSRYSSAADLARGLGMSKATGWRLLKKVERETLNRKTPSKLNLFAKSEIRPRY